MTNPNKNHTPHDTHSSEDKLEIRINLLRNGKVQSVFNVPLSKEMLEIIYKWLEGEIYNKDFCGDGK